VARRGLRRGGHKLLGWEKTVLWGGSRRFVNPNTRKGNHQDTILLEAPRKEEGNDKEGGLTMRITICEFRGSPHGREAHWKVGKTGGRKNEVVRVFPEDKTIRRIILALHWQKRCKSEKFVKPSSIENGKGIKIQTFWVPKGTYRSTG